MAEARREEVVAITQAYLNERVARLMEREADEEGEGRLPLPRDLPRVELRQMAPTSDEDRNLLQVLAYVVGMEVAREEKERMEGGKRQSEHRRLPPDVFVELMAMLDVTWGPREQLDKGGRDDYSDEQCDYSDNSDSDDDSDEFWSDDDFNNSRRDSY